MIRFAQFEKFEIFHCIIYPPGRGKSEHDTALPSSASDFFRRRRQWVTKRNEVLNTAVLRKVVGRNAHAAIPKCNMGYDQYTVRND